MDYYARPYATGLRTEFSRESAWWAFDFVANWMTINFRNMSLSYVYPAVAEWQPKAFDAAAQHTTQVRSPKSRPTTNGSAYTAPHESNISLCVVYPS
jgi:dipeptidase